MTKFKNTFSYEVYINTYKFEGNDKVKSDDSVNDTFKRVALAASKIEEDKEKYFKEFLSILQNFKFVPGGRITSNAGTNLKGTTLINCFVSGPTGKNIDSMDEILNELKRQGMILKSEGGYGFCADFMRPRGGYIQGIGVESPGAVKMLEMWDKQSEIITAGSGEKKKDKKGKNKIRKGAQMVTMSIWHPSIEEFITAKQTPGRLTKFNMSVLISDEFMNAVKKGLSWKLEFPDTSHEKYDELWDGVLDHWKKYKLPVVVYKEFQKAQELWDLIMKSTYDRNEPGVLFVDTMNKMNNLKYCEYINATNPCGEQILPSGGSCLLGSINLTQYLTEDFSGFDFKKLEADIPIIVRFMDNINDISNYPLPEQKEQALNKRRIGLGYLGYASALYLLQVKYGSKKALKLTEELCSFVTNKAYQASALLAKEKGTFPAFEKKQYLQSNFLEILNKDTIEIIKKYGIRNSHLTSIQPTGNSSVYANNVSSGLEPIFLSEYIRTVIVAFPPEGLDVPKVDFNSKELTETSQKWQWVKEGDEDLVATEYQGYVYKIDKNRGLVKEEKVQDYAVAELEELGIKIKEQDWAVNTSNLTIDDHVKTMEVFAKYIDSAISKTVNLPNNYPYEDFKNLYEKIYSTGFIKGCTTYRSGTMSSVLSESSSINNKAEVSGYIKRPKELISEIHQLKVNGEKWIVLVGLLNNNPYEVFAFKTKKIGLPAHLEVGTLIKLGSGVYNLSCGGWLLEDISRLFESDEQDALTRIISTSLRNGVKIEYIVEQLLKAEGSVVSFSKAIARTLKKYVKDTAIFKCKDCGSKNILLEEGCFKCKDCGNSKCE